MEQDFEKIKQNIANDLGINLNKGYNGDLKSKDAGRIGGVIGGNMVKTMIEFAEQEIAKNSNKR